MAMDSVHTPIRNEQTKFQDKSSLVLPWRRRLIYGAARAGVSWRKTDPLDERAPQGMYLFRSQCDSRVCMEGLIVSQSAPDGPYGPYAHITPLGNA